MSSQDFVWAIDQSGKPTKCKAKPENRGKGSCKHLAHSEPGESQKEFFKRCSLSLESLKEEFKKDTSESITQDEIDVFANRLDEICGTRVTEENYEEVLDSLTPQQLDALNKLGFEAAPAFSLPITDEMYDDINLSNKIYFSELPDYKIGGKRTAINDMFGTIGQVPVKDGESYEIKGNYRDGIKPRDYFEKVFSTRGSQVQKTVVVSNPGHTARILFHGLADMEVIDDCGNDSSDGIMGCSHKNGICKKCAEKSGMKVKAGQLIGSIVSTNLTEGLTQTTLNAIHTGGKSTSGQTWASINKVLSCKKSDVSKKAYAAKTTREAREIIYNGLKEKYAEAGIGVDDYNLQVFAKQATSYKRDEKTGGLRLVKDGELCDFPSMEAIGGHNNLFLQANLRSPYSKVVKPQVFENSRNAVTEMM